MKASCESEVSEGMKICLCSTQHTDTVRHMSTSISHTHTHTEQALKSTVSLKLSRDSFRCIIIAA